MHLLTPKNAAGHVLSCMRLFCLSVFPVRLLTFQNLDLET